MFRCTAQALQHPAFSLGTLGVCLSDAGHSAGTESPELRERHPDRNPGLLVSSPPICAQRCCSIRRRLRRSDRITETLASLHWLCASERIQFKLAMLIFRSSHGLALQYLADDLIRVADMPSRHRLRLRSVGTHPLEVPRVRLATISDRTFPDWNSLPSDVVDCQTVDIFRRRLKHFFFNLSFS